MEICKRSKKRSWFQRPAVGVFKHLRDLTLRISSKSLLLFELFENKKGFECLMKNINYRFLKNNFKEGMRL